MRCTGIGLEVQGLVEFLFPEGSGILGGEGGGEGEQEHQQQQLIGFHTYLYYLRDIAK